MHNELTILASLVYVQLQCLVCLPSQTAAVPLHSPLGLKPSPSQVLVSIPINPYPESQT